MTASQSGGVLILWCLWSFCGSPRVSKGVMLNVSITPLLTRAGFRRNSEHHLPSPKKEEKEHRRIDTS